MSWRSSLALMTLMAALRPNVAEGVDLKVTEVVNHTATCGTPKTTVKFTGGTGDVTFACIDAASTATAVVCDTRDQECIWAGVGACGLGFTATDSPPTKAAEVYKFCWATTGECDTGATVPPNHTMDTAIKDDVSWDGTAATPPTTWTACGTTTDDLKVTEVVNHTATGCGTAKTTVKFTGGTTPVTFACIDASSTAATVQCDDAETECEWPGVGNCALGFTATDSATTKAAEVYKFCWANTGDCASGATVPPNHTMTTAIKDDVSWDGTAATPPTTWTDCGTTESDRVEFDTVVRISSQNCKATDIGRDYAGDGESTTTISPEDAITNDSVYIGGDVTTTAGTVVLTCKKAPVGEEAAVEVERSFSVTIPALLDLRSDPTDDNPAIMLNECQKLLVKRDGSTTSDGVCFDKSDMGDADCSRSYAAVPSSSDSSLNASPVSGGGEMPGWIEVGGVGCNVPAPETGTTGSPGGGSVMAGLGVGALIAVCAAVGL